jgi:hypothetical protein
MYQDPKSIESNTKKRARYQSLEIRVEAKEGLSGIMLKENIRITRVFFPCE